MYPGTTILSGAGQPAGARRDWSPIAHQAEHDMYVHTPDPTKHHATSGGTMLPRSDHLGKSFAFDTADTVQVVVDATDPFRPETGQIVDMAELRARCSAPQSPVMPQPVKQAAAPSAPLAFNLATASAAPTAPVVQPPAAPAAPVVQPPIAAPAQVAAAPVDLSALLATVEALKASLTAPPAPPVVAQSAPEREQAVAGGPLAILAGPPQRPRRPVVFRMPGGTYRQHFHHISKHGNSIFLFYDDRYTSDSRFQPNPTENDESLVVTFPDEDDVSYRVYVLPLSNRLDYVDIIQLFVCDEPEAPDRRGGGWSPEEAGDGDILAPGLYSGADGA